MGREEDKVKVKELALMQKVEELPIAVRNAHADTNENLKNEFLNKTNKPLLRINR